MKKLIVMAIAVLSFATLSAQEIGKDQHLAKLPAVDIQTIDGKMFNTADIQNDGKPVIVSLWATWCKPCIAELMAIADEYEDWVEETGVKLYAVSIDDAKTSARVAPFVNGILWAALAVIRCSPVSSGTTPRESTSTPPERQGPRGESP